MRGMLAGVAVAAWAFWPQMAARSAEPPSTNTASVPENMAIVEIAAPAGARVIIGDSDEESQREFIIGPLEAGQLTKRELTVRFSSGGVVSKTLLLRSGERYRIALRDPQPPAMELVHQIGHFGSVWSVAFSPDGKQVLTGSGDRTAILWDAETGTMLRRFVGHQRDVDSVAFAPNGKSILTGSWDGSAILWDATTGNELRTFEGYACAAFSPDGQRVLTGSLDKTATLWDATTGNRLRQFVGDPEARRQRIASAAQQNPRWRPEVTAVAFSADGKQVLTGESDLTSILWDADTGEQLRVFEGHQGSVSSVAFSPDGKSILTGAWDNTAILWDVATGARLRTFEEHKRGIGFLFRNSHFVSSVAFSPDGKSILTGSWDDTAILRDATTGNALHTFKGHTDNVTSVAFSPDGKRVLTGSREGGAILWDVSSGDQLQAYEGHVRAVVSMAFSSDESLLVTGYRDGTAVLWDTAAGKRLGTFATQHRNLVSVAFSPDGQQILTGSIDGAILWDVGTKDQLRTFRGNVEGEALSPDGKEVLTWTWRDTAVLWDAATGTKLRTISPGVKKVLMGLWSVDTVRMPKNCTAFSPDGKQLLIGYVDGRAILWDIATEKRLGTFQGGVISVAFSPDGKRLLTSLGNGSAVLLDAAKGTELRRFEGHERRILSVAFSPDGRLVLIGGEDETMVLWDAQAGSKLRTFTASAMGPVDCVHFSPTGRYAMSGSGDGMLRLWDITTGDELCRLIALAGDDWLVVTPEGLFDGTPGGIRKLTYRTEDRLSVAPVERLDEDFHHPGLLARLLKGERPQPPKTTEHALLEALDLGR